MKSDLQALYGDGRYYRALLNPSFYAVLFIRLCLLSPKWCYSLFRLLLVSAYSIDVGYGAKIGKGLVLPHPINIVIGGGAVVGSGVTLYQGVTIGKSKGGYPKIGNGVKVFPGTIIVGGIAIGSNAVIGAASYVDRNVDENEIYKRK